MTDRKVTKNPPKTGLSSHIKTGASSSQKRTVQKQWPQKQQPQSTRKNLMAQFEKAEAETKAKEKEKIQELEPVEKSSLSASSISSNVSAQIGRSIDVKNEEYGIQLPRSYILAVTGLQEAIVQRDATIKKLTSDLNQEHHMNKAYEQSIEQMSSSLKEKESNLLELKTQIKLLKETATEDRQRMANLERENFDVKTQLKNVQESKGAQKQYEELLLTQLKRDLEKIERESVEMRKQKNKLKEEVEAINSENKEVKAKERGLIMTIQTLEDQLRRERQVRLKAEEEVAILKKQTQLLAQRTVIVESEKQEQNHVEGRLSRQPLLQMAVTNKLGLQSNTKREQLQRSASRSHYRKPTQGSLLLSRERSTSRMCTRQNCPELISQYRELMRHEKELIGLNYQLQSLEKGLAGHQEGKGDLHRNYQKVKRECEYKEMQIKELKSFLNDPLR